MNIVNLRETRRRQKCEANSFTPIGTASLICDGISLKCGGSDRLSSSKSLKLASMEIITQEQLNHLKILACMRKMKKPMMSEKEMMKKKPKKKKKK